jgi:hypothetical protein
LMRCRSLLVRTTQVLVRSGRISFCRCEVRALSTQNQIVYICKLWCASS